MRSRFLVFMMALCLTAFSAGSALAGSKVPSASSPVTQTAPANPTDESKVPHYFGPYPNWANSPLTLPDATVTINGDGTGAQALASVGPNGRVDGITVTDPGSGYSAATVDITGSGTGALASAMVTTSGVVSAVTLDATGNGYLSPVVTISGGGSADQATGIAYGSIDQISLDDPGSGYTMPTVEVDAPASPDGVTAQAHVDFDTTSQTILGIVVDDPGTGYTDAPQIRIIDGTRFDPIAPDPVNGRVEALASATIQIDMIVLDSFGSGYTSAPTVAIDDSLGQGTGAQATATVTAGGVTSISVDTAGSGYVTPGGIKKFQDPLPGLCNPANGGCPTGANAKYIPLAVPDTASYPGSDTYVIGLVQYRTTFSSDLPPTLARGYVQLETPDNAAISQHFPLVNELKDGGSQPVLDPQGNQYLAVTPPQWLGPTIVASRDRPVRIVFHNLLPTGSEGDLFLPVDSTMMGSGMGPMDMAAPQDNGTVMDEVRNPACTEYPKPGMCFQDNRATLHLHGGVTPWISDGTPHQWITPAGETTAYPQGVSVKNVPDMDLCNANDDGCQTFFYTNQQSARLMFYHDHAWGITRLNVYAGEAAGYLITDAVEQQLFGPNGLFPNMGEGTPLVIQDRTFVPDVTQLGQQDPTWDAARWGTKGSFWYHHVYMPAQNPGDPSGMSSFGRWMYGPWFWPPAGDAVHGPIQNPYFDPSCKLDVPSTWQYQTDPFCEPALIPGTPNISAGMEQFNDTPIVNGTAYPDTGVDPQAYRFRLLNAANDRFWNLQWYVADDAGTPNDPSDDTEVALNSAELAAAQLDPNIFPTPDTTKSPKGPSWIQIGSEGGFLPAPVVVPNQPITWIIDPTRFDVGNVDQHSLLLAPAERADVIVDFSKFAGKTLILYNDAPAAFPARVACYDYYTGGPDLSPACAPTTLPGYGPNTRTIMRVHVAGGTPAPAFDLTGTTNDGLGKLQNAFKHHADGSGVFEKGQHPIIVGQAAYNSAYGTNFIKSGWCNSPTNPSARCDGFARISEQGGDTFNFNTLRGPSALTGVKLEPKGLHDEMNSANFDEFGRMTANLGLENVPATPGQQNLTLYPYASEPTEIFDATNLPVGDWSVTPIASASDGTQIWKITHNGVDTHPIHFHLYDVQVLNRVTWDNIIMAPEGSELGWKDTVRISPLQDTIVALRPIVPALPFGIQDSHRVLNPMMPEGAQIQGGGVGANGQPNLIPNTMTDFGWEYVWHCHILSHEEMDMMRPVIVNVPSTIPDAPVLSATRDGGVHLTWTDGTPINWADPADHTNWGNQKGEVGYQVYRADVADDGTIGTYQVIGTAAANAIVYDDPVDQLGTYSYKVIVFNEAGSAESNAISSDGLPGAATGLTATIVPNPALIAGVEVQLSWLVGPRSANMVVERTNPDTTVTVFPALPGNATSFTDTTVSVGTYQYQVKALNYLGASGYAGPVPVTINQVSSQVALISSLNPSIVGDNVTFTATVSAIQAAAVPSGSIAFSIDGGNATTVALDPTGVASFSTSALPAGDHTVLAQYGGDTILLASEATLVQTANKAATTTLLVSNANPSVVGDAVTFTASVSPAAATGTVQFTIDGATFTAPVNNGSASYSTSTLALGGHVVSATYGGDASFLPSTSATLTQTIGPRLRATTTVVTSSRNPSSFGQSVTFTAQVRPATGTGTPTGTVQFSIDGVAVGAPIVLSGTGRAVLTTNTLVAGSHSVVASYGGSTVFAASGSAALNQVVRQVATTVTITSNRNPSVFSQPVTFTIRVSTTAAIGTVQLMIDGSPYGAPLTLALGRASLVVDTLAVGSHSVSATYSGSTNYAPATGNTLTQTVNQALSRTTVATSLNPAPVGVPVVITATVSPRAPATALPTGSVQFYVDGATYGSPVALNSAGQAAMLVTNLAAGRHTVVVLYTGAFASSSATYRQTVR